MFVSHVNTFGKCCRVWRRRWQVTHPLSRRTANMYDIFSAVRQPKSRDQTVGWPPPNDDRTTAEYGRTRSVGWGKRNRHADASKPPEWRARGKLRLWLTTPSRVPVTFLAQSFQLVSFPSNTIDSHVKLDFRHDIQVRVDHPQKVVEPLETYITYRVTTKVCAPRPPTVETDLVFDLVLYFRPTVRTIHTRSTSSNVGTTISYGSDKTSLQNIPIV